MTHSLENSTPDSHTRDPHSTAASELDLILDSMSSDGGQELDDPKLLVRLKELAKASRERREAAREAAHAADVNAMLGHVARITGPHSKCFFSMGQMLAHPDDKGRTSQDIGRAEPSVQIVWDFVQWLQGDRRIGLKFRAPCYYGGHFKEAKDTTKANCLTVSMFTIDLDAKVKDGKTICAIRNREDLDRVRALLRSKGMFLFFTSSSHDPQNGLWCCKFILWSAVPMSYEEAHLVGKELRLELANTLGITKEKRVAGEVHRWDCIDPVVAHPVQCQLSPRWADYRRKAQAEFAFEWENIGVWDPSLTYLARAKEALKAERVKKTSKAPAILAMSPVYAQAAGSGKVDARAEGIKALDKLGAIFPGSGSSDADLWQAAKVLRNWGWDQHDALVEMEGRYPNFPSGRVTRKIDDCFRHTGLHGSWLRQAEEAAGAGTELEQFYGTNLGICELSLGLGATSPASEETGENNVLSNIGPQDALRREPPQSPVARTAPVEEVSTRYLPALPTFAGLPKLVAVKAPPGTGKNERLTPAWKELEARGGRGACVSYRRALTRANTQRWTFQGSQRRNYMDCTSPIVESVIDVCVNSLGSVAYSLTLDEVSEDITVWDEWQQLLRHVFSNGSEEDLIELWAAMGTRFKRSRTNIIQDAHLNIVGVHAAYLLLDWADGEQADDAFLVSTWKGSPQEVNKWQSEEAFHRGFLEAIQETTWAVDEEVWLKDLFLTTSAIHAETMYQQIIQLIPPELVLLITADSIRDDMPGVREGIADPKQFSKYRVVIGSPAIFTGLSIEERHWRSWVHLRASVGVDQVHTAEDGHQALSRTRAPIERNVWAEGRASFPELSATMIHANLQIRENETKKNRFIVGAFSEIVGKDCTEILFAEESSALLAVKAGIMAKEALYGGQLGDRFVKDKKGNLLEVIEGNLWKFLRSQNCRLVPAKNDAVTPTEKKAIRSDIQDHRDLAEEVFRRNLLGAGVLPMKRAQELMKCPSPPPGTGAALNRTLLENFYNAPATEELVKRDRRGKNRGRVKRCMHVVGIQELGEKGRMAVAKLDAEAMNRSQISLSAKSYGTGKRVVAAIEALFHIKSLKETAANGTIIYIPATIALPDEVIADLQRWLKIRVTKANLQKPARLLSSLLAKIGIDLASDPQRVRNPDGTRTRLHRIDRDSFDLMMGDGAAYYSKIFEERPVVGGWVPPTTEELVRSLIED
jgi:thermostable 8-oxoguanine DNA glycosylase